MKTHWKMLLPVGGLLLAVPFIMAQGPGGFGRGLSKQEDVDDLVTRMMAFDANKDGKLTKAEVTDERLVKLFDRADADHDGTVTKADLTALGEKEYAAPRGFGGGPGGPPGGPGGPGGFGGPGGPGGGPGMRPGDVLPPMLQGFLGLSAEQKAKVTELQAEVDAKLAKILTTEQMAQFKQMRDRGPGGRGPGGPGGPGGRGPGGPGGPPGGRGPGGPPN